MNAPTIQSVGERGEPAAESAQGQFMRAMLAYGTPAIEAMGVARRAGRELDPPANFWEIWGGYTEILGCLDALETGQALLGASVRATPPIRKAEYMRFVVTTHFHELYILRERLRTYAQRMARLYAAEDADVKGLAKWVLDQTQEAADARGRHVHGERFDTKVLHELSSFEFIANSKFTVSDEVRERYRAEQRAAFRTFRKEWKLTIEANRAAMSELLDRYFETLGKVMLREGAIVPPPPQD